MVGQPDARDRRPEWGLLAVLIVAVLAVAAWNGHQDRRIADRLRRDGVEVDAEVIEYRHRSQLNATFGDLVKVAFLVDGHPRQTWVVVAVDRVPLGPTRIRYLRTDPDVARLVRDFEPRAGALAFWLIFLTIAGLVAWGISLFLREMDRQLGLRPTR